MSNVIAFQHLHMGIGYFRQNRFTEAIAAFDVALQIAPDDPYARWNRATALLSMGDYTRGFAEHEVAWRLFHWRGFGPVKDEIDRISHLPRWRGERSTRVLAYHELGFGDAIMAFRFLPELKRRCGVTLVIDPCLARLARAFDVEVVTSVPDNVSGYDFRLPLFGIMSALGVTEATIPAAPYIGTVARGDGGDDHAAARGPRPRTLGIAWSGRTQIAFSAEDLLSRLAHDGFELYSLQPGAVPDTVVPLPPDADFADVAMRIAQMDHIVTVDTAAAHLAGAMGHPSVHVMLPHLMDWRWWRSELWYPRLKTYRQTDASDWSAPFAALNAILDSSRKCPASLNRAATPASAANGLAGIL